MNYRLTLQLFHLRHSEARPFLQVQPGCTIITPSVFYVSEPLRFVSHSSASIQTVSLRNNTRFVAAYRLSNGFPLAVCEDFFTQIQPI